MERLKRYDWKSIYDPDKTQRWYIDDCRVHEACSLVVDELIDRG